MKLSSGDVASAVLFSVGAAEACWPCCDRTNEVGFFERLRAEVPVPLTGEGSDGVRRRRRRENRELTGKLERKNEKETRTKEERREEHEEEDEERDEEEKEEEKEEEEERKIDR